MPVFASGFGLVLFDFAIFVWIASEIFGAALVPRLRQRGATRVKRDRGSRALITISILISMLIAFYFGYGASGLFQTRFSMSGSF
ncbi:hypothetical protein E6H30_08415 [Candidatus Bathyarchaeota archaeon]|nr:MAG: hypothetical protein E6H30_08415 [Candidatus Bathyarchaeota archaeon]